MSNSPKIQGNRSDGKEIGSAAGPESIESIYLSGLREMVRELTRDEITKLGVSGLNDELRRRCGATSGYQLTITNLDFKPSRTGELDTETGIGGKLTDAKEALEHIVLNELKGYLRAQGIIMNSADRMENDGWSVSLISFSTPATKHTFAVLPARIDAPGEYRLFHEGQDIRKKSLTSTAGYANRDNLGEALILAFNAANQRRG